MSYGVMHWSCKHFGIHWCPPWCWYWRAYGVWDYLFATNHDAESYWWRVVGWEIWITRKHGP